MKRLMMLAAALMGFFTQAGNDRIGADHIEGMR